MALPRRSAPPPPGQTAPSSSSSSGYADVSELEKYKLVANIGKGSFGVISKVQRLEDGKEFALKQIDYAKMTDKDRKQILAEVAILESLKHRNIVQLVQKIKDPKNERIFIIMEYCTSGDLGTLIRKAQRTNQPLHEDKVWNIFLQITQALHHCHWPSERSNAQNGKLGTRLSGVGEDGGKGRCQVLHRDLKPENVFLSDDFVKLGDFGLSKDMGTAAFTSTYVGTPLYMPPEILAENKYDTKSDIWSLGCLLFELCALTSPFSTATTQTELITMVRSGKLPSIPPMYSQALRTVIKAMLNLNPAKRPTTTDLLSIDEMKLHRKLFTVQNQSSLLLSRKDDLRKYEEQLAARTKEVDAREKAINAREAELAQREAEFTAKEEAAHETQQRLNAVAEQLKLQWDKFREERDAAGVAVEPIQQAVRRGSMMPTRPMLEERATMPIASSSRQRAQHHLYEDTPSKIPAPSAPPLSLRRHASKSLGNLAAIARSEAPSSESSPANGSGIDYRQAFPIGGDQTPAKQVAGFYSALTAAQARAANGGEFGAPISIRSPRQRPGRSSIGSPGDLKQRFAQYYNTDITMASAGAASPAVGGGIISSDSDASMAGSPFIRPGLLRQRKSSTGSGLAFGLPSRPAAATATATASASASGSAEASGSQSGGSAGSVVSGRAPIRTGTESAPCETESAAMHPAFQGVRATPAKWSVDDPDLPSPFLRRMPTAPAAIPGAATERMTTMSRDRERERERDRMVLGQINPQPAIGTGTTRAASTAPWTVNAYPGLRKAPIPRSKSGNLHQVVLQRNAVGATAGTTTEKMAERERERDKAERVERVGLMPKSKSRLLGR